MQKEIALDTRRLHGAPIEEGRRNIAILLLEYLKEPNYYDLHLIDGELVDPLTKKNLESWLSRRNPIHEQEYQAALKTKDWANNGRKGYLAWISPSTPDSGFYKWPKMVVSEKLDENGVKVIRNHVLYPDYSPLKLLFAGLKLLKYHPVPEEKPLIENPQDLRANPIEFQPPNDMYWIDFLAEIIVSPEEWTKVKTRYHFKRQEEVLKDAQKIMTHERFQQIQEAKTFREHIWLGALIERHAQKMGYTISQMGFCGANNLDVWQEMVGGMGYGDYVSYQSLYRRSNGESGWKKGKCRICGSKNIEVGPCQICKKCAALDTKAA